MTDFYEHFVHGLTIYLLWTDVHMASFFQRMWVLGWEFYFPVNGCRIYSKVPVSLVVLVICYLSQSCCRFINFIDDFTVTAFCLIDFLYYFSIFNLIDFFSCLYYFLPSACPELVLFCSSFSSLLKWELSWLIWGLACFLM